MKTSIRINLKNATIVFLLVAAIASVATPVILVIVYPTLDSVVVGLISGIIVSVVGYAVTVLIQMSSWQQEKESQKLGFRVESLRNILSSLEKEEQSLFQIKSFLPQFETLLSHTYTIGQETSLVQMEWTKQRNTLIDKLVELCGYISNRSFCGKFTELFSKWNGQCILGLGHLDPVPNEYSTAISEFQTKILSELERVHDEKKKTIKELRELST